MLYPGDFVLLITHGNFEHKVRRVLARIALNALVDPQKYPVDLSEVNKLHTTANLAAWGFLTYMANHPIEYGNRAHLSCESLLVILKDPADQASPEQDTSNPSSGMRDERP